MPSVCSAFNCTNRGSKTTGISYFRFPLKNEELTKQWVINMRRDKWYPTRHSCLCSSHFQDRFIHMADQRRRLLAKAIPTIFSFSDHLQKSKSIKGRRKCLIIDESDLFSVNVSANQPAERENQIEDTDPSYSLPCPKKVKQLGDVLRETNENVMEQNEQDDDLFINQESKTENLGQRNEMVELCSKLKSEVKNITSKLNEMEKRLQQFLRHNINQG